MPERKTFVAVDFETTGLHPDKGHRVIEIGAVKVVDDVCTDFQTLIAYSGDLSPKVNNITGITDRMLESGLSSEQAFREFHQFIGELPLVFHNAKFDKAFLEFEFHRIGIAVVNEIHCTLNFSRRVLKISNYRLETVARYLGISTSSVDLHRALEDARITGVVWCELVKRFGPVVSFHAI